MPVVALSANLIRKARCPDDKGKVDYFDSKCKGLQLEVRATGGKTWYLRYTDARGKQHQHRIADVRDLTLDLARQQANNLRSRIALGEDPAEERAILRTVPTLEQFVTERYMPYIRAYKRSWRADDSYLRNHILPRFGKSHLDQIIKHDVIDWHHKNRGSHLAPATTNRLMILFRYIFNLALKWEIPGVTKNPTEGIPMFEVNNQRERYLTKEEAVQLYEAVLESKNPMLRYIVPMLIMTGARKHEVLEAQWTDFDLARRSWRIPTPKAGKARHVPLSEGVIRLLEMVPRIKDCPYAFPNPHTLKPYSSKPDAWYKTRELAGLEDVRLHDLRHSFASFMVNSGRSLYEVQQILGHANSRMTQRYAHLSQTTLVSAANAATEASGMEMAMRAPRMISYTPALTEGQTACAV